MKRRTLAASAGGSTATSRKRPRYLVTGGTGFLGTELCVLLVGDTNAEVIVLARRTPADASAPVAEVVDGMDAASVSYVQGDVLDRAALVQAMQGVDGVFHLAGSVTHSRRQGQRTTTLYVPVELASSVG